MATCPLGDFTEGTRFCLWQLWIDARFVADTRPRQLRGWHHYNCLVTHFHLPTLTNSRFEYVKTFEQDNILLPECHIVIRVDGRGFHKFTKAYNFAKPNDERAIRLMNRAAELIVSGFDDVLLAYGDSDEYSFLLRRKCTLFERREPKLTSTFASTFTSYYVALWPQFFPAPEDALKVHHLPTFDARCVVYPNAAVVRDYFSWRQVDCHINNLYNTTFWTLVQQGNMTPQEAEKRLSGTLSQDKHEILFTEFGFNYNNDQEMFKKGTVVVKEMDTTGLSSRQIERQVKKAGKSSVDVLHVDIIRDEFWDARPWLLQ